MKQTDVFKMPDGVFTVERGLRLRVRSQGRYRSWEFLMRLGGKTFRKSLGSASTVTLAQARERAAILRGKVVAGEPLEQKEDAPQPKHRFKDVFPEAVAARREVAQWTSEKHAAQWMTTLTRYAVPVIGSMDVADVTRDDILKILTPIWKKKNDTATKVRERLEICFDYFLRRGWRQAENPARWRAGLEFDLAQPKKVASVRHHEAPTFSELMHAMPRLLLSRGGCMIAFGILTACRCEEFIKAKWSEIDLRQKVFMVPPERRKDKRPYPHRVPLSKQAVTILASLDRTSEYVFPGLRAATMSIDSPRIMLSRVIGRKVTMHGCRSTFSDWCAENGKDETLREKSLSHTTGNEVANAYQRSDLLERRRVLMQEWADALFREVKKNGPKKS